MAAWTKERIADKVYAEMKRSGGGGVRDAAERFVSRLRDSQKIAIMDELGVFFVLSLEQDHLRREHPTFPLPVNHGRNLKAEAAMVVGQMVAIGQTGLRMAVGQLTATDCQAIADYHNHLAVANRSKSVSWALVAKELPEDATVADAWGVLGEESRTFLQSLRSVKDAA